MQQIHTARTLADAYMARDVLQSEGVPATIRNEHLVGVAGDVPIVEGLPSVWVADGDVARARFVLDDYLRDDDAEAALGDLDDVGDGHDVDAQTLLGDLASVAGRLARRPADGGAVDDLRRLGAAVAVTGVPFGVEQRTWERIGRLVDATLAGAVAADAGEVGMRAAELGDAVRPLV